MPLFSPVSAGGVPKATVTATTGSPSVDTSSRAGKTIYNFTGSGSITVGTAGTCEIMVLGGGGTGGGGSGTGGGGGGAGGLLYDTNAYLPSGTLTVFVGAGGVTTSRPGVNGNSSRLGSYYGVGGGCGQGNGAQRGNNGGSGGGRADMYGQGPGTGTSGQGNNGGSSTGQAGGGGGAGSAGTAGTGGVGGNGGNGLAISITGSSITYAGGGGGSHGGGGGGAAGSGGGTAGVNTGRSAAAAANSGGGSGGVFNVNYTDYPGNGGSGRVIVVIG
jgi:hypothetical protein